MRRAQFILTSPAKARTSIVQPSLVFKRYGKDYFLSEIWLAGSDTGRRLPPGRKETELARRLPGPERQAVLGGPGRPKSWPPESAGRGKGPPGLPKTSNQT